MSIEYTQVDKADARERHDPETASPESRERHVHRYLRAIELAREHKDAGGVWWDVACGLGYGTVLMPGETIIGLDKDPAVIRDAALSYPQATFGITDVTQAGWPVEFMHARPDVVLSVETLEHLSRYEQHAFLAGASSALKKRGVFVLACPLGNGRSSHNPWHKHEPTEDELRRLLAMHFARVLHFESEPYESTSGPAVQAFAVAR